MHTAAEAMRTGMQLTRVLYDIALAGNVNGNAGTVTLTSGQAISQSAGVVNTTGTLTGSAGTSASLNQANTIANLGAFTTNGAFTLNDTTGGLNVTGAVSTTNNGLASITTTGGNLAGTTGSVAGNEIGRASCRESG